MPLRRSTICGVGVAVLAALLFGASGDAPMSAGRARGQFGGLFVSGSQRFLRNARIDETVIRSRQVAVDFSALADPDVTDILAAARPTLLLNLFDDTSFSAVRDRIDQTADGFTWVGHIPGIDLSTVTLSSVDGVVAGSVVMPEAVYSIRYVGAGLHEVAQVDQSRFPPESDPIPVTPADMATAAAQDVVTQDPAAAPVAMGDDGTTIDVLVLYTPAAATAAGGASAIAARINLGISEANTSYINSGITQRLRLANSQQVAYAENNALSTDLYNVSNRYSSTAIGDTAASLRDTYSADLVMLVTSPGTPDGCGVSWLMTKVSSDFAPYGFSIVEQSCISPNYTFAHELGHNMGARHDWYVDSLQTPYTYSHGYIDPPNRFRTVMSYNDLCSKGFGFSCTRLLYWSNPAVNSPGAHGGAPMGIAGGTKTDCSTGDASNFACDADDHRTLNSTALTVANFRQSLAARPTPVLTWLGLAAVVAGTPLGAAQLNATATVNGIAVPGAFVYNPGAGSVLTAGSQTLTVTFTPTDGTAYTTATLTQTITVCAAGAGQGFVGPPAGGWSGTISGSNLLYNGTAYPIANGRVNFPDCTTFIVGPNGSLMGGAPTPNCTRTVCGGPTLVTPTISWPTPAAVTAGTPLSGTQLNATASANGNAVAGKFVYTPPAGTAMSAVGSQTLSVAFTPTDGATYRSATATVTLQVTSGSFVGPANGGGWSGTVSGSNLLYNGVTYPIVNGRVNFPDCTTFIVGPNGALMGGSATPNCTPGGGGGLVTPTITWGPLAPVTVGTTLSTTQLNASSGGVAGSFEYAPALGTVLTSAGSQALSVTFRPTDGATYAVATKTVSILVTASGGGGAFVGPPTGGWSGTISGQNLLYNGGTYPIVNGRVNFPDCTTFIVGPNGSLMGGAPTPNCTPGGGGGLITPTITWGPLASVTVGTTLSTTQLNASSGGVAGSFEYAPALGTVLTSAGSQALSVTFRPTDGATYAVATKTVSILVTASGGGGVFVGPANGGGWSGSISGSNLLYNGVTYLIVNGRVSFPDCTMYIVGPNGALMGGSVIPNCTPADR